MTLLICGVGLRSRREVLREVLREGKRGGNQEVLRETRRGGTRGIQGVLDVRVNKRFGTEQGVGKSTSSASKWRGTRSSREALERGRGRSANTRRRAGERDGSSRAASSGSSHTRSGGERRGLTGSGGTAEAGARVGGRGGLDRNRDDLRTAKDDQAECTLLLLLDSLGGRGAGRGRLILLALVLAKFLGIGEDQIHVLFDLLATNRYVCEKGKK